MRSESSFDRDGDLIVVEAILLGPRGRHPVRLVLDTGAALTTLVPAVAEAAGYSERDRVMRSVVRSAVGVEHSYVVRVAELAALRFVMTDFAVNVCELGHGIDGLLGMNFLNELNYEIRSDEGRILVEKIAR
jgi:clan AA aspartic protease (TIGR02281 family)